MSCYHPVEAWDYTPDDYDGSVPRAVLFRDPPLELRQKMIRQGRRLLLPCRKCIGCRLDKSREWANRVVMEQAYHQDSWFVTLTYDDQHLPAANPVDPSTGEILSCHATLVKSDLQLFFKRLRFNTGQRLRYFVSGEYGTQTYRPHYHCVIFGLSLNDLHVVSHNFSGSEYYVSDMIAKCWPQGLHVLGRVTWQSAAYVARYTLKKATHGFATDYYRKAGIVPEFQSMSLRPGIGYAYYRDHPELFDYKTYAVSTPTGGRTMTPPEYFRKLWLKDHPIDAFRRCVNSNIDNLAKTHIKLMLTDRDYYDILKADEERELRRSTRLLRDDI